MPVPQFLSMASHHVRRSDDLLVIPETKANDPSGEPQEIDFIDVGEKWVYINLKNPVNRKRVFKFEVGEQVAVVRVVDTPEDVAARTARNIARAALEDQRHYWQQRQRLATLATRVTEKNSWREGRVFMTASAGQLRDTAQRVEELEYAGQRWTAVANLVEQGQSPTLIQALHEVAEGTRNDIVRGYNDTHLEDARKWLRDAENVTRRYEMELETSERNLA